MTWFPIGRRLARPGSPLARLASLAVAAFILSAVGPGPAAAQQPPRRFFVFSRETEKEKDGIALIERDGTSWAPLAKEIGRDGRLSPDTTKFAWFLIGSQENPKITLLIQDLRKKSQPVKLAMDGLFGRSYWSRDGRELIVTTSVQTKDELTYQTWRVAADGLKTEKLPIPATEMVRDWSRDGHWLVTTSSRHAAGEKPPAATLQDIRLIHPDGTGERMFHRLSGPSSNDSKGSRAYRKSTPLFSRDSRSLLWIETAPSSSGDHVNSNPSRIMVQNLTDESPKEIMRAGDDQTVLAGAIWSPDSRSLVLQIQERGSRARQRHSLRGVRPQRQADPLDQHQRRAQCRYAHHHLSI